MPTTTAAPMPTLNNRQLIRLEAMLDIGLHPRRIAKALDCHLSVAAAAAKSIGRTLSNPAARRLNPNEIEYARAQYKQGAKVADIARDLGRNRTSVQKWIDENKAPPPAITRRPCITCRRPMKSEGSHHRQCPTCRQETATIFTTHASVAL
jgi:hypothetical protein